MKVSNQNFICMITFLISWNFRQNHSFNSTATWPICSARLYLPATFSGQIPFESDSCYPFTAATDFIPERFSNVLHASFQNCSRPKHCSCTSWSLPWTEYRTGAWLWSKFLHFRCCFDRVAAILFYVFARKTHTSQSYFGNTVLYDETKIRQITLNRKYLATFWTLYYN